MSGSPHSRWLSGASLLRILALTVLLLGASFSRVNAQTLSVIHTFTNGNDGGNPYGSVTLDSSGNMYGTTNTGGASGAGTIWKYSVLGHFSVAYSFNEASDGGYPNGNITFDSYGNMYGTCSYGGSFGYGTVWEYSASGHLVVLHSFTNGNDGSDPYGSVTLDSSGNMYGTASNGGAIGAGTLWEYSASGIFSVLHTFTQGNGGGYPYGSVTLDGSGNMYGTTAVAGTNGSGTVWEYSALGNFSVLHIFTNGIDGHFPAGSVTFDSNGNMYGTALYGGASDAGTVWEYNASGNFSVVHTFTGGNDGGNPNGSVTFDSYGNMYGTTESGGPLTIGTIWE